MQTGTCETCGRKAVLRWGFCSEMCRDDYEPPAENPKPESK